MLLKGIGAILLVFLAAMLAEFYAYKQWTMEQQLSNQKQESDLINSTALEIGSSLSTVITLQRNLFYTAKDAMSATESHNDAEVTSLHKYAQTLHDEYISAWNPLKEQIRLLIWKAYLNIDNAKIDPTRINRPNNLLDKLGPSGFECKTMLPPNDHPGNLTIEWNKSSDNIQVIYFCLQHVHDLMKPIRNWATSNEPGSIIERATLFQNKPCSHESEPEIQCHLDNYQKRFEAFILSFTAALSDVRKSYRPPNILNLLIPTSSRSTTR